ncbi:threonine/serine exporter family protein [Egbenema bharatensis]|uniref:threonine/serine exporter family protein n=1 Tax=Egbenema bharatensis TaxID=3463334 RepID=UPI003A84AE93
MLTPTSFLLSALFSFTATFGFAVLYNVPRKALLPCSAIGMGAYLVRTCLQAWGASPSVAIFFGALFLGTVGAIPAKWMQLPIVLFVITGIIPIVPGTAVYRTIVFFYEGDVLGGLTNGIEAGFGIGAIAAGIGAGRILTDPEWGFERN